MYMMRVRFTSEAVRTVPTTVAELLTEVSASHTRATRVTWPPWVITWYKTTNLGR